jgi:hypothetical protein
LDFSRHIILNSLNISYTDNAAVKFRYNSSCNQIKNSNISYTGRLDPANGEAVYIGASKKFWAVRGPDFSNNNKVRNNHFGPFISSESVDIKEGVEGAIVENNVSLNFFIKNYF